MHLSFSALAPPNTGFNHQVRHRHCAGVARTMQTTNAVASEGDRSTRVPPNERREDGRNGLERLLLRSPLFAQDLCGPLRPSVLFSRLRQRCSLAQSVLTLIFGPTGCTCRWCFAARSGGRDCWTTASAALPATGSSTKPTLCWFAPPPRCVCGCPSSPGNRQHTRHTHDTRTHGHQCRWGRPSSTTRSCRWCSRSSQPIVLVKKRARTASWRSTTSWRAQTNLRP